MIPKVSILIPCYNATRWIAQTIESALNQTHPNKEVIVVDDGSTDGSLDVVKSFGDRIRWETGPNRGGNVARNRLLELSTGQWLQYLDADDYLLADKIEKQIEFLSKVTQTDIVYSPSIFEYSEGNNPRQEILPIPEPHDPWILLARWYLPQTGSPLWRKQAIIDVGGWKVDQPCCQEHELYLRLLMAGKRFEYFNEPGSVYRQWSESTICKKNKSETYRRRLEIKDKIEQHLKAEGELTNLRQDAINQARFECSRIIWISNKKLANNIISSIHKNSFWFVPSSNNIPLIYLVFYKLLGFFITETIVGTKRSIGIRKTK